MEDTTKRMKTQTICLEKIFENHIYDKNTCIQICKEFSKHNNEKITQFSKESTVIKQRRNTDAKYTYEKMLTSLVIKEKQIKTTINYYYTPIRRTKNNDNVNVIKC